MSGHNLLQQVSREPGLKIVDPGASGIINVDRTMGVVHLESGSGAETRDLATPQRAGVVITFALQTDGGGDVTVNTKGSEIINDGGSDKSSVTLGDAGDSICLISIPKGTVINWAVLANNGCTTNA